MPPVIIAAKRNCIPDILAHITDWLDHSARSAISACLLASLAVTLPAGEASAQGSSRGYLPPGQSITTAAPEPAQEQDALASPQDEDDEAAETDEETGENLDVAVIIGNEFYQDAPNRDYAYRDADAIRDVLIRNYGFNPAKIIWLKDTGQAEMRAIFGTRQNIQGRIWRTIDPEGRSRLFVFYSGHGTYDIALKKPHILPVDTPPADVAITGYPLGQIYSNLSKLPVKSVVMMLETSFSGRSRSGMLLKRSRPAGTSAKIRGSAKVDKLAVITAASGKQFANLDDISRHGIFTSNLLSGLTGGADLNLDGKITLRELYQFVQAGVIRDASGKVGEEQTPRLFGNADLVIGRYEERKVLTASRIPVSEEKPPLATEPTNETEAATDSNTETDETQIASRSPDAELATPQSSVEEGETRTSAQEAMVPNAQTEQDYWEDVKDSGQLAKLESYLETFPDGQYRTLASQRIAQLKEQEADPAAEPSKPQSETEDFAAQPIDPEATTEVNAKEVPAAQTASEPSEPETAAVDAPSIAGSEARTSAQEAAAPNPQTEQDYWESVRDSGQIARLESYLQKYPDGQYGTLASQRIVQLKEQKAQSAAEPVKPEAANIAANETRTSAGDPSLRSSQPDLQYWNDVKNSTQVTELEGYLEKYPQGRYRTAALSRIEDLEEREAQQRQEETRQDIAKPLQAVLKDVGCYFGRVDGVWGPKSRAALQRFSRHSGKSLSTFEATQDNLRRAQQVEDDHVCPARQPKRKPRRRHVEEDRDDDYDRDDDDRYVDYEDDEPPLRESYDSGYGEDRESTICWGDRNRIVDCDDPTVFR